MKIRWGAPTETRSWLIIATLIIIVLAVLFWPNHTVYKFSVAPGQEATVNFTGKSFPDGMEYNLFVNSVNASAGTAEISVFVPASSAYSVPPEAGYEISWCWAGEQNWAVTLKDFAKGGTYVFKGGNYNGPLFKLEEVKDNQVLLSVADSWTGDDAYTRGMHYTLNQTARPKTLSVVTRFGCLRSRPIRRIFSLI